VTSARDVFTSIQRGIEGPDGPRLAWTLRSYRPDQLSGDVVSGLTVAALIVPLSIGYAGVAGLPPEIGLYASLAPLVAYAVFGSARKLIVGPDASTAALIAATIAPLAAASDDRVRLASLLGLLVAGIFIAMRIGRMGFLADFLSRPILVGYMTGVGITVALGQIEKILGGPAIADGLGVLSRIDWLSSNLGAVVEAVWIAVQSSGANLPSVVIGAGVIVAMVLGRRYLPRIPMALPAMIVALIASAALDLQSEGVRILGPVPAGLPSIGIPLGTPSELFSLLPGALGLALLSFADTTATGRTFAARDGERTDANRELVALAAADAAGAITSGYAISSSPSRTSAAIDAGSSSQMTGLIAAVGVAVVLVLLTGPLASLPIPALGAVILVSVIGLIDVGEMRSMWLLKRSEGIIAVIAMAGVILYGTLIGVGIAVLLAALNIVRRAAWPKIAEEGRLSGGVWRDVDRFRDGQRVAGVIVVRFTGPLFFANATALETRIRDLVARDPDASAVVIDLVATADIDLTSADVLHQIDTDLERDGRRLAVARPSGHLRDELQAYGLAHLMEPTGGMRGSIDDAIVGLGLDPTATVARDELTAVGGPDRVPRVVEDDAASTNRLVLRVLGIGVVVVVGAAIVGILVFGRVAGPVAGQETVPNLVGLSLERARVAAGEAGFDLAPETYIRTDNEREGTVVDQDPPAGTVADVGSEIVPFVSTERQLVLVPDVVGEPESQAIADLSGAGLTVRRGDPVDDPSVPRGTILQTTPVAGTRVAIGTSITYVTSTGQPGGPDGSAEPEPLPSEALPTPTATVVPTTPPPSEVAPSASP
jgi:sulfate permease, SulP family